MCVCLRVCQPLACRGTCHRGWPLREAVLSPPGRVLCVRGTNCWEAQRKTRRRKMGCSNVSRWVEAHDARPVSSASSMPAFLARLWFPPGAERESGACSAGCSSVIPPEGVPPYFLLSESGPLPVSPVLQGVVCNCPHPRSPASAVRGAVQSRGSFKFKEPAIPLDLKGWAKTCIRGGVPLKSLALVSLSDCPFLQPKAFFLILMDQKYLCC